MDAVCPALQSYIHMLLRFLLLFYRSQVHFSACSCTIAQTRSHIHFQKKEIGNEMHELSFNKRER